MLPVEQMLEGLLRETLWHYMCVPEILQMRVAAQGWDNATGLGRAASCSAS